MTKRIYLLLMIAISLFLVACSSATLDTTASESSDGAVTFPTIDPAELADTSLPPGMVNPNDYSLVANTGNPQFLDSYAVWCEVCQANRPIVHNLRDTYAGQVDFFELDIENPDSKDTRDQFDITGRFQYILIDADGNVLKRWFGPLNEEQVSVEIAKLLSDLES